MRACMRVHTVLSGVLLAAIGEDAHAGHLCARVGLWLGAYCVYSLLARAAGAGALGSGLSFLRG